MHKRPQKVWAGRSIEDLKRSRRNALLRGYREAVRDFKSLSRVIEYDQSEIGDDDVVRKFAPRGWTQLFLKLPDAAADYKIRRGNFGGFTSFFHDQRSAPKCIIFIRKSACLDPESHAAAALPVFFHELGHVDDFQKGLNLKFDAQVDIVAAEHYAHAFSCRQLYDRSLQIPLSFYMASLERESARCGLPTIEESARRLIESAEYDVYRKYVSPIQDTWDETFPLDRTETN